MVRSSRSVGVAGICLAVIGIAILVFGAIAVAVPNADDEQLMRANGLATAGLGLFGTLIALVPFQRRERWAWFALWFYPVFWAIHLAAGLPPGKDHVHQVVFIALSLAALLWPANEFLSSRNARTAPE